LQQPQPTTLLQYELSVVFEQHPNIQTAYNEWYQLYMEFAAIENQLLDAEAKFHLLQSR